MRGCDSVVCGAHSSSRRRVVLYRRPALPIGPFALPAADLDEGLATTFFFVLLPFGLPRARPGPAVRLTATTAFVGRSTSITAADLKPPSSLECRQLMTLAQPEHHSRLSGALA